MPLDRPFSEDYTAATGSAFVFHRQGPRCRQTWTLDTNSGPMTAISRNNEWGNPNTIPYKRRRQMEKLSAQQRKLNVGKRQARDGQP